MTAPRRVRASAESERAVRRHRARERALGRSRYTDAAPVRAHVRALLDAGMGYPQIAKCSQVDQSSLIHLMCGRSARGGTPPRRMSAANAEALLAIRAPQLAPGARVVHIGAARRGQALVAAGWGLSPLSRECGVQVTILRRIVYGQPVWKASADTLIAAYDRLWDQVPTQGTPRQRAAVTQAKLLAARRGWVPPLCWDDDEIDDPQARPLLGLAQSWGDEAHPAEVAELVAGRKPPSWATQASRDEAFRVLLVDRGWNPTEVADRLGVPRRTAERARARLRAAGQQQRRDGAA